MTINNGIAGTVMYSPRSVEVDRCTDQYIWDIKLEIEVGCDSSGGACVCQSTYSVYTYNDASDIVFDWSVAVHEDYPTASSMVDGATDERFADIWTTADEDIIIEVTCTATSSNGVHTITKDFVTNNTKPNT